MSSMPGFVKEYARKLAAWRERRDVVKKPNKKQTYPEYGRQIRKDVDKRKKAMRDALNQ